MLDLVGNTPLVRLNRVVPEGAAEVLGKLESLNPGGSVKDRIALAMIEEAEARGVLKPGDTIVEPTSGNTGIGLAMVAAVKGYKLILTMPEDMSVERRRLFTRFGAELVLTPAIEGMSGAVYAAQELCEKNRLLHAAAVQQPGEPGGAPPHDGARDPERDRRPDRRVRRGVGTGGTITGVGEVLKAGAAGRALVAVEPARSPVLAGGKAGHHGIQGIGASFVPGVLNRDIYDELIAVKDEDAFAMTARLTTEEGLLVGISGRRERLRRRCRSRRSSAPGKRVVTVLCDTGERYLSVNL